jgi:hypothetical protein
MLEPSLPARRTTMEQDGLAEFEAQKQRILGS